MEPAMDHPTSPETNIGQISKPIGGYGAMDGPKDVSHCTPTSSGNGALSESSRREIGDTRPLEDADSFEDILYAACGQGRWQNLLIIYMSVMWLILPFFSMSMMFVGASPPFKCADGFDSNATYNSLPDDVPECAQYGDSNATCTRWVWSDAIYQTTVVTEWALVCDRKPLLSLLQAILMLGGLAGALVAGQLADRIGRRPVFLPAMALIVAMAFSSAAVTDYSLFVACRFFSGVAMALMIGSQYVLASELTTARVRSLLSSLTLFPFLLGILLVSIGSYWIRERRLLQLAYAVPSLSLIPNIWLMPESPRWLAQHGRHQEACTMLERGCRWNGRAPPPRDKLLAALARLKLKDSDAATAAEQLQRVLEQLLQLVQTPRMRRYTMISALAFFVASGSYFGIAFDTTQLSDDPHLIGVLSALTELPVFFSFILLDWCGRRRPVAGFFLLAAVCMFLKPVVHHQSGTLTLGLIGKLGVAIAFNAIYVFTPEYLPTSVRAVGFGVCQVALRLGACVSPFVVDLASQQHRNAPSLVFGGFALVTGLATLLLPETKGMKMPATVQEVEQGLVPEVVPRTGKQGTVLKGVPNSGGDTVVGMEGHTNRICSAEEGPDQ